MCAFLLLLFSCWIRFCALTACEMEPCIFGKCELTPNSFKVCLHGILRSNQFDCKKPKGKGVDAFNLISNCSQLQKYIFLMDVLQHSANQNYVPNVEDTVSANVISSHQKVDDHELFFQAVIHIMNSEN